MKNNYFVAIDLDGTLIKGLNEYDDKTFNLLKDISKENYIIIATGRPYRSSKYYYDLINLNTPIINYNGALVHHPKDKNFTKIMIKVDKEWIKKIVEDNNNILINVFCEVEDDIFLLKKQDEINNYLHLDGGNLHIGNYDKNLIDDPNGAIMFTKLGTENILEKYINNNFDGKLKIRFWHDDRFVVSEIYSPLTTKGNGIKKIIEYYNIDKEKTIAIGDGHNDIEMFEEVKIKVAMANAHPQLLQKATIVTKSNLENGVYHFLKDFFK